ncbi:MAG TPA: sulfite exporter TauE/SafE family protein, partial [Tepidisphaeraceae bacterium]|nr:sulfite exporter TauE/SafE family protein [Tepidisphaeraceae bacterium]
MTLTAATVIVLLFAGLLIGVISGMVGIGGGLMIVPLLTLGFAMSQKTAGATSLAVLVLPVFVLAVISNHRDGLINWPVAITLACGVVFGALIGAKLVSSEKIPENTLRILFAILLIYGACSTLWKALPEIRAAIIVSVILITLPALIVFFKLIGKRYENSPRWSRLYQF